MGVVSGIVVFVMIWWTAIFTVLPWGLKRDERGIPNDPRLKIKFIQVTVLSAAIWIVVYILISVEVIDFYALSDAMMKKDYGP